MLTFFDLCIYCLLLFPNAILFNFFSDVDILTKGSPNYLSINVINYKNLSGYSDSLFLFHGLLDGFVRSPAVSFICIFLSFSFQIC